MTSRHGGKLKTAPVANYRPPHNITSLNAHLALIQVITQPTAITPQPQVAVRSCYYSYYSYD